MRIGAKVPNSGPLPGRLGIGAMAAELEAAGFDSLWVSDHIVLPSRDRVPVPVRRRRTRHLADRHPLLRRHDRAGADRAGDRARGDRDGRSRAPAAAAGRLRQAGRIDRRRERRPAAARRRRGLARGGVRRPQRPLRGPRPPARGVDLADPRVLDRRPRPLAVGSVRPALRRALPADACTRRPAADRRPFATPLSAARAASATAGSRSRRSPRSLLASSRKRPRSCGPPRPRPGAIPRRSR